MTKSWSYRSTQDKLLIFVSSRLQECKEERSIVQDVISVLNHQPVLFEHLGARPYSSRDLYLSRLRDSNAMVAIYRSGYGYIDAANGMEISGLEDEFRLAQRQGINTLFYVWHSNEDRSPRLDAMINEIKHGPYTISFYNSPEELRERVRDDLTALITERFISAGPQRGVLRETSTDVLARALGRASVVINRAGLIEDLNARSRASPVLCLYGPPGIGKTTLAALFAQSVSAVFVRASGLVPKDIFAVCANALHGGDSAKYSSYSTLEGARLGLATVWTKIEAITIVVDECDFVPELIDALLSGGGTSPEKRLIFTSREPSDTFANCAVPPLTPSEVDELLTKTAIETEIASQLRATGNPHQLLQALAQAELGSATEGLARLDGTAGELLRYLALSNVPLSAEDLLALRADSNYSIEALYADISHLGRFIDDGPRGLRLMHAETAAAIVSELCKSPQRLRFYVNRLIRLFEDAGDLLRVYELASLLNDGSEKQYAAATAREAARLGDWRLGVKLINQLLEQALDTESKAEAFHLMLSLVYPLELMGDVQRAAALIERAQPLAEALGPSAQTRLEETEISSRARRGLSMGDVTALKDIYRRYGDRQQRWDQARVGLELSAIYMAAKDYEQSCEILRPTLATFEELGDDYGVDLAQKNLASTLSALPGHEEEAERIIGEIEERTRDEPDARRQRAWLCNILTHRLRRAGRYEEAETLAKEAIEIGAVLGDESLRATNFVNLGNIYRDQERPELAIETYEAAAVSAQKCGRRDVEADSSRLVAGIFNDFSMIEGYDDRHARARVYAQHAIGLLRGSLNYDALACSLLELGEAQEALGEPARAAEAFFEAAQNFSQVPDEDNYGRALVRASHLALPDHVDLYLERLADALGVDRPNSREALADQFIILVRPLIECSPRGVLIPLLGGHLHQVWSHLPEVLRGAIVSAVTNIVLEFVRDRNNRSDPWRVLYAGIVLSYLLKDKSQPFLNHRLAQSVMLSVEDLFVREEGVGSRIWTIVLNLGRRVTISISPLDETPETTLAGFALAMFIKAFENELGRELIGGNTGVDELMIHIGHIDHMSEDVQRLADQNLGLSETLTEQACVVTRPSDFGQSFPTVVFLSSKFFHGIVFGEGRGGALQMLFGLTLVELTFQLLRGQVEMEVIRPKVISLVRRTLS